MSVASIAFSIVILHCLSSFIASRILIKSHSKAVKIVEIVQVQVVPGFELNAVSRAGVNFRPRTAGHVQFVLPYIVFLGVML